jgi:cell division transport system ATP-binding protein
MEEKPIPIISFTDADILNGENVVIYGLNMEVYPGQVVYIVGKVGTGKTSIIRTIIAENHLLKGSGTVCGYDLATIKKKDIPFLRRKLGVVFQDFQLLMDRTVEDNLAFVLKSTGWKDSKGISARILEVLTSVGMETKAHKMPYQLSGGEQQRIAIARAILNDPEVIIADEPTGNLDSETAGGILELLKKINEEKGTAIVMVTHNRTICKKYPGRIFETRDEACGELEAENAQPESVQNETRPEI